MDEYKKIMKVWKEKLEEYSSEYKSVIIFEQQKIKKGMDNVLALHKDFIIVFNTDNGLQCIKDNKETNFGFDEDSMRTALRFGLNLKPVQTSIFDFLGA